MIGLIGAADLDRPVLLGLRPRGPAPRPREPPGKLSPTQPRVLTCGAPPHESKASPHDAQSVHQAVPDDRRADARPARRLAGDGGADALPPRARLRRGVRARAGQAAVRLPHAERRARVRRQRLGRAGVGGREPRAPRRHGAGVLRRQVRRALDRPRRGLRRRARALRAGLGRAPGPGRDRPPADRERGHRGRVRDAQRDLHRRRPRHRGDRRGGQAPRRHPRRRRRVRPRRGRAAPGRLGRRRRRRRLAEGADVPARARVRVGVGARARVRRRRGPAAASTSTGARPPRASARARARSRPPCRCSSGSTSRSA